MTISIGGNDSRFADVIKSCLLSIDCRKVTLPGSSTSTTAEYEVPALIRGPVGASVQKVIAEIHAKAPKAKIVVAGYPRVYEASPSACLTGIISQAERQWIADMADALDNQLSSNVTTANGTGTPFAFFANPKGDFIGRGVCTSNPAINDLLLTKSAGDSPSDPQSAQSYHPNKAGQQLYANALNRTLRTMGL